MSFNITRPQSTKPILNITPPVSFTKETTTSHINNLKIQNLNYIENLAKSERIKLPKDKIFHPLKYTSSGVFPLSLKNEEFQQGLNFLKDIPEIDDILSGDAVDFLKSKLYIDEIIYEICSICLFNLSPNRLRRGDYDLFCQRNIHDSLKGENGDKNDSLESGDKKDVCKGKLSEPMFKLNNDKLESITNKTPQTNYVSYYRDIIHFYRATIFSHKIPLILDNPFVFGKMATSPTIPSRIANVLSRSNFQNIDFWVQFGEKYSVYWLPRPFIFAYNEYCVSQIAKIKEIYVERNKQRREEFEIQLKKAKDNGQVVNEEYPGDIEIPENAFDHLNQVSIENIGYFPVGPAETLNAFQSALSVSASLEKAHSLYLPIYRQYFEYFMTRSQSHSMAFAAGNGIAELCRYVANHAETFSKILKVDLRRGISVDFRMEHKITNDNKSLTTEERVNAYTSRLPLKMDPNFRHVPVFFENIAYICLTNISSFSIDNLIEIGRAYGKLNLKSKDLLKVICARVVEHVNAPENFNISRSIAAGDMLISNKQLNITFFRNQTKFLLFLNGNHVYKNFVLSTDRKMSFLLDYEKQHVSKVNELANNYHLATMNKLCTEYSDKVNGKLYTRGHSRHESKINMSREIDQSLSMNSSLKNTPSHTPPHPISISDLLSMTSILLKSNVATKSASTDERWDKLEDCRALCRITIDRMTNSMSALNFLICKSEDNNTNSTADSILKLKTTSKSTDAHFIAHNASSLDLTNLVKILNFAEKFNCITFDECRSIIRFAHDRMTTIIYNDSLVKEYKTYSHIADYVRSMAKIKFNDEIELNSKFTSSKTADQSAPLKGITGEMNNSKRQPRYHLGTGFTTTFQANWQVPKNRLIGERKSSLFARVHNGFSSGFMSDQKFERQGHRICRKFSFFRAMSAIFRQRRKVEQERLRLYIKFNSAWDIDQAPLISFLIRYMHSDEMAPSDVGTYVYHMALLGCRHRLFYDKSIKWCLRRQNFLDGRILLDIFEGLKIGGYHEADLPQGFSRGIAWQMQDRQMEFSSMRAEREKTPLGIASGGLAHF